jgi:UDP-N-acetylmuramoyl-L-alanyl-D-glutamate--2,6-diaminopimelate ligase
MQITLTELIRSDAPLPPGADTLAIAGLTADSRAVKPGFLFAALPGSHADGAKFIPQAMANGAVAAIGAKGSGAIVETDDPRRLFALAAARFYKHQPDLIVAVTGTNGKTSVASFVRQIWLSMGFRAASLGTIGVVGPSGAEYLQHTTPDPVQLHEIVARLADDGVRHLAIEASSHGLAQHRLDGLHISAGGFTNLTRDHLDYHASFEEYFDAKMRLFEELLPKGAPAVINRDGPYAAEAEARAVKAGLRIFSVGGKSSNLKLVRSERDGFGQRLDIETVNGLQRVMLPLAGDFQASNALVAAGLVIASGGEEALALHALESLKGAKGRLDLAGRTETGAPIFVDYAHTPDALETALKTLRPYAKGRLSVVFGCGGDRDKGKRPEMGAVAMKLADRVIVTDDNPRSEVPEAIRKDILVAGKGHEEGQIVGKTVVPFSDHDAVQAAIAGRDYHG